MNKEEWEDLVSSRKKEARKEWKENCLKCTYYTDITYKEFKQKGWDVVGRCMCKSIPNVNASWMRHYNSCGYYCPPVKWGSKHFGEITI